MVWGVSRGIDDLVDRVGRNDPALRSLCLFRNRTLTETDARSLFNAIAKNHTLQELNIASHAFSTSMTESLAAALSENVSLRHLEVGDSSFGDSQLEVLCRCLQHNTSLLTLDLENKSISTAGCVFLAAALEKNKHLQHLLLSGNAIGAEGVKNLVRGLGGRVQVSLSSCAIDGAEGGEALSLLFRHEGCRSSLRSLFLDDNGIDAAAAEIAAKGISGCSLTHLSLCNCPIESEGALALARELPPSITDLDLSGTKSGHAGISSLAARLNDGTLSSLERLSLAYCNGTDPALTILAQSIALHPNLLDLDLSGNEVGPETISRLRSSKTLKSLRLHDCGLGRRTSTWEQLLSNPSRCDETTFPCLEDLDVSANDLDEAYVLSLLRQVTSTTRALPSLMHLLLAANPGALEASVSKAIEDTQNERPNLSIVRGSADSGEKM